MSRIAIGQREIGAVLARRQTFFLRPAAGSFDRVHPGHRIWLAEPFFLEQRFDDRSPTWARDAGAIPIFAADNTAPPKGYGPRRPARMLCREWHRFHLLVTNRRRIQITEIADADLRAMGFADRGLFAEHWDRESALFASRGVRWRDNPAVLRFGFKLMKGQLPANAKRPAMTGVNRPLCRRRKDLPAPAAEPAPPSPPVAADATPPSPSVSRPETGPRTRERYQTIPRDMPPVLGQEGLTTAKADKAFLAALKRERADGHADLARPVTAPRRPRILAPPLPATGSCPRCGTRLAYGCEHYPAHHPEAAE